MIVRRSAYGRFGVESKPDIERYGVTPGWSWILEPAAPEAPSFLVSIVTPDQIGILRAIAHELARSGPTAPDGPYTITASLSSAHCDVGVLAIVVRSAARGAGVDGVTAPAGAWSNVGALRHRVETAVVRAFGDRAPVPEVRVEPLGGDNEQTLFGHRAFGEMRFGPLVTDQSTSAGVPEVIGALLTRFSAELRDVGSPIAFFDIGHRWHPRPVEGGEDGERDGLWLRIAYGLPRGLAPQLGIDLAAARVATRLGLDAWVDLPDVDAPETLDFHPVVTTSHTVVDDDITGATRCVVIDGLARTGFIATVLDGATRVLGRTPLALYGGSGMVLHGRTIMSLLTDDAGAEALRRGTEHAERQLGGFTWSRVERSSQSMPARLTVRGAPETFWVSWFCGERPGALRDVLDSVHEALAARGVGQQANVLFAVSRELRIADSCAGKVKFHAAGMGTPDEFFPLVRRCLADRHLILPGDADEQVTRHEPTRAPWAALDRPRQPGVDEGRALTLFGNA